jgi:hypothetical protein
MRLHALTLVLLLAVGCAQVTVDGERTSLPLPVAAPVKCASKTGSEMADPGVSTAQKVFDGIFAVPLFVYQLVWGTILAPLAEATGSASVTCKG